MSKKAFRRFLILTVICLGFFYIQIAQNSMPARSQASPPAKQSEAARACVAGGRIAPMRIGRANFAQANEPSVVINEIAWMGTESSANYEWIELYNKSDTIIDLTGWTLAAKDGQPKINLAGNLPAGGYFLLERSSDDTLLNVTADQIYTGALGNSGEDLELKDSANNLIDEINASTGWPAGDNTTKATMERKEDGGLPAQAGWQTSASAGGTPKAQNTLPQPSPTEGEGASCGNSEVETGEQCDDGNLNNGDGCDNQCKTEVSQEPVQNTTNTNIPANTTASSRTGDIVINEFVSDPADDDVEWIELYNITNKEIDLTNWTIEDGSGAKTKLSGALGLSGNSRFKVILKPSGNLNNAGDIIILHDASGKLIDQVAYGNWDDGNKENNAPVAGDPASTARIFDGQNTFNNANDFAVTEKPTKGLSNIIQGASEISMPNQSNLNYSSDIFISEIFPNPLGADNDKEFIEIYNRSNGEVNLYGWSLSDSEDKKKLIEQCATSSIISAYGYITVYRPRSKITLNNDSDEVKLYKPQADKAYQSVKYADVIEGWSYNLSENCLASSTDCLWQWSESVTPGEKNILKTVNHPPTPEFNFPKQIIAGQPVQFDSSDTTDTDGRELKYFWDFGDGIKNNLANPQHTFLKAGIYEVSLTADDGELKAEKKKTVIVYNTLEEAAKGSLASIASTTLGARVEGEVIINEILPNPAGDDAQGEWLELKNQAENKINLLDWQIENNSDTYKFFNILYLNPGDLFLLKRQDSKLTLNNQSGRISLFNNLNGLADLVEYGQAAENESYARGENGKWFWTTVLTPGEENIISVAKSNEANSNQSTSVKVSSLTYLETTLDKIVELDIGESIKTKGIVAVLPGVLGTQFFYIIIPSPQPSLIPAVIGGGDNSSPQPITTLAEQQSGMTQNNEEAPKGGGMQIYNYKKDFPEMKVGDVVEVTGELSQSNNELRIKTKTKDDMKILENVGSPVALALSCDKINEEYVGQLISVKGEITQRKSSTVYLDDGADEMMVYIKSATGIDPKIFTPGITAAVTGILGRTSAGVRLMPRSIADIALYNSDNVEPAVLGEVTTGDSWQLETRNKKLELFKYLLIIAGAVIVLLGFLLVKKVRSKQ